MKKWINDEVKTNGNESKKRVGEKVDWIRVETSQKSVSEEKFDWIQAETSQKKMSE
ncbi:hypothetical protein H9655_21000 [Cytobacillus sp. Sa5YUA1]|uniref:Uncharacterized protein n=1 Tax=Cytobacillus stercorigallinarum TaxID=2762240 RepID=A0ABR8QVP6_9BACI|nr:hypothetical protein [Cytobacillus stercorigallinarum]MBD7939524.1 hypothetical protein [Cytobacillus stercorigallinarum]